jgi:hypothetical protein
MSWDPPARAPPPFPPHVDGVLFGWSPLLRPALQRLAGLPTSARNGLGKPSGKAPSMCAAACTATM